MDLQEEVFATLWTNDVSFGVDGPVGRAAPVRRSFPWHPLNWIAHAVVIEVAESEESLNIRVPRVLTSWARDPGMNNIVN
jgi:hypothetical protein